MIKLKDVKRAEATTKFKITIQTLTTIRKLNSNGAYAKAIKRE